MKVLLRRWEIWRLQRLGPEHAECQVVNQNADRDDEDNKYLVKSELGEVIVRDTDSPWPYS